jgi:hypothetical protein
VFDARVTIPQKKDSGMSAVICYPDPNGFRVFFTKPIAVYEQKMPDYGTGSGSRRNVASTRAKPVEVPSKRHRSKKTFVAASQGDASSKDSFVVALRKLRRLLTTNEVMGFVHIKRRDTICKYVRKGKLKAHSRIGNGYRFCPVYIADWIESHEA